MEKILNRSNILTEKINPKSEMIDAMSTEEIIRLINEEDGSVHLTVRKAIPEITKAVDLVVAAFKNGGHLRYFGAGTSGRLSVLAFRRNWFFSPMKDIGSRNHKTAGSGIRLFLSG